MAPRMLRPPALTSGDRVQIVAPASPFSREAFDRGVEVLRGWGLQPTWRDDVFDRRNYFAGSPARRAAELTEAFADPSVLAVIAARGGYGVTTAMPLVDVPGLAASPKPFVGCSDLTALLNALVAAGLPAIHGPMVCALGRDADSDERLRALLFDSGRPGKITSSLPDAHGWCISPGVGRGPAVGGNLSLLAATCGTPWQVQTDGCVLFLEEVGERPYRVDRLLVQLQQAGLFDGLAGVVLGDFTGCADPDGPDWRDAVARVFRRLSVPVVAGFAFGHGTPNLALPLGSRTELDASAGWIRFRDAAVS